MKKKIKNSETWHKQFNIIVECKKNTKIAKKNLQYFLIIILRIFQFLRPDYKFFFTF